MVLSLIDKTDKTVRPSKCILKNQICPKTETQIQSAGIILSCTICTIRFLYQCSSSTEQNFIHSEGSRWFFFKPPRMQYKNAARNTKSTATKVFGNLHNYHWYPRLKLQFSRHNAFSNKVSDLRVPTNYCK